MATRPFILGGKKKECAHLRWAFSLFVSPVKKKKRNHRNFEGLHFEMLTTTCHQESLHRFPLCRCFIWPVIQVLVGGKPLECNLIANVVQQNPSLCYFLRGVKFWLWTSKGFWKLIMLCNITPLCLPHPPTSAPLPGNWEGAHIAHCWLTCSRVVTAPDLLSGSNHLLLALCAPLHVYISVFVESWDLVHSWHVLSILLQVMRRLIASGSLQHSTSVPPG